MKSTQYLIQFLTNKSNCPFSFVFFLGWLWGYLSTDWLRSIICYILHARGLGHVYQFHPRIFSNHWKPSKVRSQRELKWNSFILLLFVHLARACCNKVNPIWEFCDWNLGWYQNFTITVICFISLAQLKSLFEKGTEGKYVGCFR